MCTSSSVGMNHSFCAEFSHEIVARQSRNGYGIKGTISCARVVYIISIKITGLSNAELQCV